LEYNTERLKGKTVEILPYVRGYYPRDILYTLWRAMEDDELSNLVFPQSKNIDNAPFPIQGDLLEFVNYFGDPKRIILIMRDIKTGTIIGLHWYDDIISNFRGWANMFYKKAFWGEPSYEAGQLALDYGFNYLNFEIIYGHTPWVQASSYAEKAGMTKICQLPKGYLLSNGEKQDMNILYITKEVFNGKLTQSI